MSVTTDLLVVTTDLLAVTTGMTEDCLESQRTGEILIQLGIEYGLQMLGYYDTLLYTSAIVVLSIKFLVVLLVDITH